MGFTKKVYIFSFTWLRDKAAVRKLYWCPTRLGHRRSGLSSAAGSPTTTVGAGYSSSTFPLVSLFLSSSASFVVLEIEKSRAIVAHIPWRLQCVARAIVQSQLRCYLKCILR